MRGSRRPREKQWRKVMRHRLTITCASILSCAACVRRVERPASTEFLQARPTDDQIEAQCSQGDHNEIRYAGGIDPGAPILVLEEVHLHGSGPPQPTVAIWPDGKILFAHIARKRGDEVRYDQLEGAIPKSTVDALVREVASAIKIVPRYKSIYVNFGEDGGQETTIVVRDGDKWRSADVYGAYEDDFLAAAAAAGTLPRKKIEIGSGSDALGDETWYEDPPVKRH